MVFGVFRAVDRQHILELVKGLSLQELDKGVEVVELEGSLMDCSVAQSLLYFRLLVPVVLENFGDCLAFEVLNVLVGLG